MSRLTVAVGVLALASGVVGFAGSPDSAPTAESRASGVVDGQLRPMVSAAHADVVAKAVAESVAESRGQRMSRSLARFEVQTEAYQAATAIDQQIVVRAETDAALEARAAAERAAKAKEEAERKAEAKRKAAAEAAAKKKAAERAAAKPRWVLPISGARMSASFGEGGGLWENRHTGQDFAAPTGTPVRAAGAGVIVSAGYDGAFGRKIVIRHSDGTQTWYCHLSSFVRTSGSVSAGTLIGRVGSTGNTTGPHLHFEVHPGGGDAVNPMSWLKARM